MERLCAELQNESSCAGSVGQLCVRSWNAAGALLQRHVHRVWIKPGAFRGFRARRLFAGNPGSELRARIFEVRKVLRKGDRPAHRLRSREGNSGSKMDLDAGVE